MPNPPTPVRQTMWTSGEVDITVFKRTDIEAYMTSAQSLMNMECSTTGLAKKRKSTRAVLQGSSDFTDIDPNSQLYDFRDNNGNYYLIISANTKFLVFFIDPLTQELTNFQEISGTPYLSAELPFLDWAQDGDSLVLTDGIQLSSTVYGRPPARIYVSDYTTSPPTLAYQVLPIYPYPAFDFNTINYSQYTVAFTNSGTTFSMVITGANAGNFNSNWVNGQVVALGATADQPIGYGIITSVTPGSGTATIAGNVVIPFAASASMPTVGSQYAIRQPSWSNTLGWPAHVLFYQNRLWLANTASLPLGIFGSKINQPVSYDVGVGATTDAIIYNIGQSDAGQILWLNGGKQLEIYTQNYEFACPQNQDVSISPDTFDVRQQSAYGSSNLVKPITYINDSYFVTKTGAAMINYHFNGIGQTYTSSNVSVASQHLVKNPGNRALIRGDQSVPGTLGSQDNFIYFLNPDNTLASFQFAHEYKLAALTPIIFDQGIEIKDIVTVNNNLFLLKFYPLTSIYAIEVMDNSQRMDSWQVVNMLSTGVITGLAVYNGYTVQVVYNGQDYGQYLVVGGTITVLNNPNPGTVSVQVGLLYQNQIIPMYIFAGAVQSNHIKHISRIFVDYYNSLNFQINGYTVPYQTFAEIQAGIPISPKTDTAAVGVQDGWNRFGTLVISQNAPFDLQITGIEYQVDARIL